MEKIKGLVAAPFTPMNPKGEIRYEAVKDYYGFLKRNHVKGAFINGSTGEGVSLTPEEHMKHAKAWAEAAKGDNSVKTINLVGGTSLKQCIEFAVYSKEVGIDAIAILAPFYFKPPSVEALVDFCAGIAEAVSDMPVYFYHIPVLTGCHLPMYDFLVKADKTIPNLAGIKYTHEDFMEFLSCLRFENGKYDMLWGRDENLLSALVLGAEGGVGSTFNYAAPLYYALIEAFEEGNLELARELQLISIDMIRLLGKYGGIATGKAYMKYIGRDCGKFRLPVKNMSDTQYQAFVNDVEQLNMEAYFSK